MKNFKSSFLYVFLVVLSVFALACSGKKNNTPPPAKTKFERSDLSGKSFTFSEGFSGSITFNADGTYSLTTTSGVAPDGSTGSTSTGSWSFDENTQLLTFTPAGGLGTTVSVSGFKDDKLTFNYTASKTNSAVTASAPIS